MHVRILPSAGRDANVKRLTIRIAVFALLHSLNPFLIECVSHFYSFQKTFLRRLPINGMADLFLALSKNPGPSVGAPVAAFTRAAAGLSAWSR